ncbi:aspartic peptidase A1 [Phlegmacium glaucopus]|nr:aspartic peptidase A1 [Phlegmacium glaucopus]
MQFSRNMSALLTSIIVLLSLQAVESLFISKPSPQLVTLPLKPIQQRSDIHPQILLQTHINRSIRRLAKMTGAEPPSARSLEQRLEKRVLAIEGPEGLYRRFNRFGVPGSARDVQLERRFNRAGVVPESSPASLNVGNTLASTIPPGVAIANTPTAPNSLGLDIEARDVGYLATVQMGTPPRDFLILMDSGSADLWVGSENCQSQAGGGCGNHNFLGPQSSSSFQDTNGPFSVTYGTGQVSGTIVKDNVVIAGLSLTNHVFGVATEESVDFSSNQVPFDGLMGLAQSTLSQQNTLTPIESLASAGLVQDSIVSYKISRLADNLNDGEITFGGLDNTKFDSNTLVNVHNVNTQGFWEANLDSASVNGTDAGLTGRTTILDTGTTLMVLPDNDAAAIHKLIPGSAPDGQGGFTIPCTTNASVSLTYSGQSFTIDPRDLAFQPLDPNNPQGDCVSGIASAGAGASETQWLVGDTFLKNAYFSTDVSKNTVSLAKLV